MYILYRSVHKTVVQFSPTSISLNDMKHNENDRHKKRGI